MRATFPRTLAACWLALLAMAGCGEETVPADLRLITPMATLETLFDAYGIATLPQEEIDRRLEIGRTFHLNDPGAMQACFDDWEGPESEAFAGYVFGNLIETKDDLVATIRGDEATVMAGAAENRTRPVVMVRDAQGWRISLSRSVPQSIRRALEEKVEERQGE